MADMQNSAGPARKRVYIETFGCQMNDNDSERSLGFLREINYRETMHPGDADLILINTCSIRDKAEHKVYSTLGRYKALKAENPGLVIGVSGCVAQQQGERLLKRVPYLDMVVGPHNIHKLKDLIGEVTVKKKRVVEVTLRETIDADEYGVSTAIKPPKAFVSIMRGCNNFCTYCIVPYTRGREVSRKSSEILREISALAGSGIREVTLLGQNVNSYGAPGGALSFPGLLRGVAGISGIERIRFVTSHPKDISDELIRLFGEEQKLARHIHLPVQSGADRVLEMMGRGYTRAEYLLKIKTLRRLYPDISITTDIIVGFPAETDSDFDATMALIEEAGFDNIFSFMYSRRPGTAAAGFELRIPEETSKERLLKLQETQRAITLARSRALIGRTMTVLAEGPSKADASELTGRTSCNRVVNFMAPDVPAGILTDVSITGAYPNSLRGTVMQRGSLCS
jgi:tRNA-2-methylthio-N6-dimethylallyladenosine synthase